MKRFISSIVLMCVLAPSVAFAGQGIAVDRSPGYWYSYAEKLPIGVNSAVRTTDGKRHTAVLALVDRDGITVELKSRIPEPARRISVRSDSTARAEDERGEHGESSGGRRRHRRRRVPRAAGAARRELGLTQNLNRSSGDLEKLILNE